MHDDAAGSNRRVLAALMLAYYGEQVVQERYAKAAERITGNSCEHARGLDDLLDWSAKAPDNCLGDLQRAIA